MNPKECKELGKKYFSVASGGGTGRTLHPDNMAAGSAHVEMMGFLGIGNNPMVGATVAVAVDVATALSK